MGKYLRSRGQLERPGHHEPGWTGRQTPEPSEGADQAVGTAVQTPGLKDIWGSRRSVWWGLGSQMVTFQGSGGRDKMPCRYNLTHMSPPFLKVPARITPALLTPSFSDGTDPSSTCFNSNVTPGDMTCPVALPLTVTARSDSTAYL